MNESLNFFCERKYWGGFHYLSLKLACFIYVHLHDTWGRFHVFRYQMEIICRLKFLAVTHIMPYLKENVHGVPLEPLKI